MLIQNFARKLSFSYLLIQWYHYIPFVMQLHVPLYLVADMWFNYEYVYNLAMLMCFWLWHMDCLLYKCNSVLSYVRGITKWYCWEVTVYITGIAVCCELVDGSLLTLLLIYHSRHHYCAHILKFCVLLTFWYLWYFAGYCYSVWLHFYRASCNADAV